MQHTVNCYLVRCLDGPTGCIFHSDGCLMIIAPCLLLVHRAGAGVANLKQLRSHAGAGVCTRTGLRVRMRA